MSQVWTLDPGAAAGRYEAAGGGSQTVKVERIPLVWNMTDLVLVGVPIYTPADGEMIFYGGVIPFVSTAWNYTTKGSTAVLLHLGIAASLMAYDTSMTGSTGFDLTAPDVPIADTASVQPSTFGVGEPILFGDAEPVTAMVDDGAGNDPGATHGAMTLVLYVMAAP